MKEKIKAGQVQVEWDKIPEGWNEEAAYFINSCIQVNPQNRLGYLRGAADLKGHAWFADFDWEALRERRMPAPYTPDITLINIDSKDQNRPFKDVELVLEIEET